jgi:hypothetical protein
MIIEQAAQQLSPIAVKTLLKLGVREPRRVGPVQKANQSLELLPDAKRRVLRPSAVLDADPVTNPIPRYAPSLHLSRPLDPHQPHS